MLNTRRFFIICMVLLCACIFPFSLIRKNENIDFAMNGDYYEFTDYNIQNLKQTFIARTNYMDEIAFDVGLPWELSGEESLYVCVTEEESRELLMETRIPVQDVNDEAYTCVPVKRWIHEGRLYSVSVAAEGFGGYRAIYSTETADTDPADQILYLNGEPVYGKAVLRTVYGFPLNIKNVLCLWAFIWMVGLSVLEVITHKKTGCENAMIRRAERLSDRYQIPVLLLEFGVILILVVRICRNEAVDWDEAYTWQLVTGNHIPDMLKATAADVHPPLYYLLVKAAMSVFGRTIFVAKMVSVAGMAATCLLGITMIRKNFGFKAAFLFLPAAGLGTQILYYNVNVRMYSWMMFFVLAAGLSAYEIIQSGRGRWWVIFTMASLGGVYTQYFAVVPLVLLYLFLLIWFAVQDRHQLRKWFGCCLGAVAGYLPWLTVVVDMLRRDSANIAEEKAEWGLWELCEWAFESHIMFSAYMPALLFLVAVALLLLEWKQYIRKEKAFIVFAGLSCPLSYMVCMMLASQMHHFWHNRYLVDVLLFVWLFIIIIISRRSTVVWSAAVVWLGISVMSSYAATQAVEMNTVPWTQQARQLLAQVQDEKKIVYNYESFHVLYQYWLPDTEFVWYQDIDLNEMGNEFYVIAWGGSDFSYALYENGTLEKEVLGQMRLEEGVAGVELWRISVHNAF